MSNSILGIDPGVRGALVLLGRDDTRMEEMPVIGNQINEQALLSLLIQWKPVTRIAFLEEVTPMPGQGVKGVKTSCVNYGIVRMALSAAGIPYEVVRPNVWSKVMHQGLSKDLKGKDKSKLVFQRLFPEWKEDHDGVIDAALIASWGRRQLGV